MEIISIRRGTKDAYEIALTDPDGQPSVYTDEAVVICKVWDGVDGPVLSSPAVVWKDSANGILTLPFEIEDTDLEPSLYYLYVTVDDVEVYQANLNIEPAPGTNTDLPVYCTLQDLLTACPRLSRDMEDGVRSSFLDQRAQARRDIDNYIYKKHTQSRGYEFPILKEWLDGDKLMVDEDIKQIACLLTLAKIYQTVFVNSNSNNVDKFVKFAEKQEYKANALMCSLKANLDTNSDGVADYHIDCSTHVMRGYYWG